MGGLKGEAGKAAFDDLRMAAVESGADPQL